MTSGAKSEGLNIGFGLIPAGDPNGPLIRAQDDLDDASVDCRSNVSRAGHITSDCLPDAVIRHDDSLGLERGIEIDIGCEDPCSLTGKSATVALPLPQPGPLEPAPETNVTLCLSRSPMLSSRWQGRRDACALALPR